MALLIVALSLIGLVRTSSLYEVGDSNGWTTTMGLDYYKTWSSSKKFYVGDILLFQYNETLIYLNRTGHYYFICGVPGHFESGQKLDVLVVDPINESNSPKPSEDPLEVLPVDDATIATLPYNAASDPCGWNGLIVLST
ncbi:PREDICTED: mavicyanin-like [Camelina sativa]|uniref:Mavicyanin-like n=1 Tax=Camelina sativa TaxID=90675 RepID=A0ABM0T0J0_CAMSA|nr:PREDICTED: mavicyanin-like [Camelina sativa]